ncbi:redoxin domain-containing protein [Ferruginibacter sp. SUN106]|uniref:redoxin domain-containing protein n=1 Tax=Ferruginibacter sp. SUN106 TaxID=2978348 RepID=UPI003D36BC92
MKKYILFLFAIVAGGRAMAQGYQITLQAPQFKSGIVYLTYYMGPNLNVADSAAMTNTGTAIFKGNKKLPGGIYVIVLPGKRLRTDFLIDKEQRINVKTDTTDLLNKTIVTGSKENVLYVQYQKYVAKKGKQLEDERKAYISSTNKLDSLQHEVTYNLYNGELNTYREGIVKNQPGSMMAVLLKAMKEPAVPILMPQTREDSLKNYNFYKSHYWDGVTFMDERIIRTPFFLKRLERYYQEVVPQSSDSIIKDVDYKLLLARSNPEMFKFLLNWVTDEYINPKYMGQDAVFVHLFEKYHSQGVSNWLNEKQMESISRRAYMLMANLIGEKAANLEMIDSSGKPSPLYDVNAEYTVICFWDPNCGHCKEEVPRLDSIYHASWKNHNVKIYGVLTPDDKENAKPEWEKFITEHKLGEWTHVYKTKAMEDADYAAQKPSFRQLYDINLTPTLYLLDKDKHIIGKKLTIFQLNDLLEVKWKTKP